MRYKGTPSYKFLIGRRVLPPVSCVFAWAVFFLFCGGGLLAGEDGDAPIAESYIDESDVRSQVVDETGDIYKYLLEGNAKNYDALWRLSRFHVLRGIAAGNKKAKKREWSLAREYAESAIDVRPDGAEGHLYLATSLAKMGQYLPASRKVKNAGLIKTELETAIEFDPALHKAYMVLGVWHREVATASSVERQLAGMFFGSLPDASLEQSLSLIKRSIDLGGNAVRNHCELARTYEALGDHEGARAEYSKVLSMVPDSPGDRTLKEEAEQYLREENI